MVLCLPRGTNTQFYRQLRNSVQADFARKRQTSLKSPSRASTLISGESTSPESLQRCWSPGAWRVTLCLALKFMSASLTQVKFCLPVFCCFCGPGEGGLSGL